MTPKISIVFTSFNHREFLKEALDGLINQTFKDFELIIIDDNSVSCCSVYLISITENLNYITERKIIFPLTNSYSLGLCCQTDKKAN